MSFRKLKRKVPAQPNKSEGDEKWELIRKKVQPIKIMTLLKATKKVTSELKKLVAIQIILTFEQGTLITSQIRIHFEEIKGKVGLISPAALRFIGPGDC